MVKESQESVETLNCFGAVNLQNCAQWVCRKHPWAEENNCYCMKDHQKNMALN